MSDMHFREPNQVKWQGSRPAHNGNQVLEYLEDGINNYTELYEVTAGKVLYLTYAGVFTRANTTNLCYLAIFDDTPVLWRIIGGTFVITANSVMNWSANFWPPIEVPSEYTIQKFNSANVLTVGTIHGWEE